jgi:putative hydrolase of the HAD superfamily
MSTPTISTIFFDMDDTLICHDGICEAAWLKCFAEFAPKLGLSQNELRDRVWAYRDWYWNDESRHERGRKDLQLARREIVRGALAGTEAENRGTEADALADRYTDVQDEMMYVLPNAHATLAELKRRGYSLAMITNGSPLRQRPKIERFRLAPYFTALFIEGEFGVGKPDPRVYQAALDACNARARETAMVGDNLDWDIAGAARLGLTTVWHNLYGATLPDGAIKPDYEIRDISACLDIFP